MDHRPGDTRSVERTGAGNPDCVGVVTTARLHLGFMDPSGRGERQFGSFGISLDCPETKLTLARARTPTAEGPEAKRASQHLQRLAEHCGIAPDFALRIEQAIPAHAGLGSGTQLALAVGAAFSDLTGAGLPPEAIAALLGRGKRSGIGIGAFQTGGVLVDGGHGPDTIIPPILTRLHFPDAWRVLLIFDRSVGGVHGDDERSAFRDLPAFPQNETADLCRRLLLRALPALAEANLMDFSEEVRHLQRCMGAYFAPVQGGRYTSPAVAECLSLIEKEGVTGVGQSSWGPTGFALLGSESEALDLRETLARKAPPQIDLTIARGLNRGARIERLR